MTREEFAEARRYFEGVPGLFLTGLELTAGLGLIVTVDEASAEAEAQPIDTGDPDVDAALGSAYPVTTRSGHRRFVVEFEPLVHAVTDESLAMPMSGEEFWSPLRRHEASPFLDWCRDRTRQQDDPAPLSHVALVTYDAVIDVATRRAPEITVITLTDDDLSE